MNGWSILLQYYQDVFFDNKKKVPKKKYEQIGKQFLYSSDLEDICFAKNKQLILGTLSYEQICVARSISKEFEDKLLSLASWKRMNTDAFNLDTVRF